MNYKFYNRSFKVIITKTLSISIFLVFIVFIYLHHAIEFINEDKGGNVLSTAQLVPILGLVVFLFILHGIIWVLALRELINVWYIYNFDENCMKISVLSMILKTIYYKNVTKIEINNTESNEVCKIYSQEKYISIDRNSLHYLDMKLLWIEYCKNAELVENYQ